MIYIRTVNSHVPNLVFIGIGENKVSAINAVLLSIVRALHNSKDIAYTQESFRDAIRLLNVIQLVPHEFAIRDWNFIYHKI